MKYIVLAVAALLPPSLFAAAAQPVHFDKIAEQAEGTIYAATFAAPAARTGKLFEALEGFQIGLAQGFQYGIRDYTDPFWIGRGTAAGDYDQDGWQDIVFGSDHGVLIYKNVGGTFALQAPPANVSPDWPVYAVALVDMNNDGWLDLFFTTFDRGNHVALNRNGAFDFAHLVRIPNNDGVLTLSPGFGDLDGNGQLDIVNGNIALGVITGFDHMKSRRNNSVVFNGNLEFRDAPLETTSGETMASLVSDINNDNIADIYFGNDFIIPDKILLGNGNGYTPVTGNQFIPFTPFFSMGADTGDINNDLTLDFVITGTMYMAPFVGREPIDGKSVADYSKFKGDVATCKKIKDTNYRANCIKVRSSHYIHAIDRDDTPDPAACQREPDGAKKDLCLTKIMWKFTRGGKPTVDCDSAFGNDDRLLRVCKILQLKDRRYDKRDLYGAIPQDDRNMLYAFDEKTRSFTAVTDFKHPGGWTWNAKIVDIDNDGWQDLITSDGTVRDSGYGWNVFMKNIDGKRFEQRQFTSGFAADFGLYSFALIDIDNDGILDIVGNGAEGPVQVYRNHAPPTNHRIAISLIDSRGNRNAIGAKIIVRYRNGQQAQLRELKASGGYMSFDPAIAYFGLGQNDSVDSIEVLWPDHGRSVYNGPFVANRYYRIERRTVTATNPPSIP